MPVPTLEYALKSASDPASTAKNRATEDLPIPHSGPAVVTWKRNHPPHTFIRLTPPAPSFVQNLQPSAPAIPRQCIDSLSERTQSRTALLQMHAFELNFSCAETVKNTPTQGFNGMTLQVRWDASQWMSTVNSKTRGKRRGIHGRNASIRNVPYRAMLMSCWSISFVVVITRELA